METGNLLLVGCHDNLAAQIIWNVILGAKKNHPSDSFHRQTGFGRARLIVESTMQHATVVPSLVPARTLLLFKNEYGLRWESLQKAICCRQPHDSSADNCDLGHEFRELAPKKIRMKCELPSAPIRTNSVYAFARLRSLSETPMDREVKDGKYLEKPGPRVVAS
jgi:hypothetical protein